MSEFNSYKMYASYVKDYDYLGQNSMPPYNQPVMGLSLLETIDDVFNFLNGRFKNLSNIKYQGCLQCEDARPRNTPQVSDVLEIRGCPSEFCCVILFQEKRFGGATTSGYDFIGAYVDKRPCDRIGTLLPENVSFVTIPWKVYL